MDQEPGDALNFRMIDRALDFVDRWHLMDVEVVFAFADEDQVTSSLAIRSRSI